MNEFWEHWGVFYRGLLLGLMVAAPVGPVGLLCIRRTIQKGLWTGFASGFGAAFADALFSAVAAFGITAITQAIRTYNNPLYIIGGLLLFVIAWHTWHDKPRQPHPEDVEKRYFERLGPRFSGVFKAMLTSFLITITNPGTIFGVVAFVATFGGLQSSHEAPIIVGGIFAGSSLWWLTLSGSVSLVRKKFTENRVVMLNRATAILLTLIALWVLAVGVIGLCKAL